MLTGNLASFQNLSIRHTFFFLLHHLLILNETTGDIWTYERFTVEEGLTLRKGSGFSPGKKKKKKVVAAIPADFNSQIIALELREAEPAYFQIPPIISRHSCKTILPLFPDFCLNNVFEAAFQLRGERMRA